MHKKSQTLLHIFEDVFTIKLQKAQIRIWNRSDLSNVKYTLN